MTTQKLSSEKLLDRRLFQNLTRRRLSHILVAFLVNFFSLSVPILFAFGDLAERSTARMWTRSEFLRRAAESMRETMTIHLVFMFLLGIYFGVITLGYMMKRRSAHFYHALPQRRETLYTTGIASALTCAAVGGLLNLCIATVELGVYSIFVSEVLSVFFTLLVKNIVFFLVAYAITVFAGSFSGNSVVQVLMSLVIMLYPLAVYYGVILLRDVHSEYFYTGYYFSEGILRWLSPISYAAYNYWGDFKLLPTLLALLVIATLLLGGMAIYKKRAVENSERPIVFRKLGSVLKYMLMFAVTLYAGLFFYAISEGVFYMVFGFFSGALLSFMLFNTILEKSPKAMFKGMKGLVIFVLAFALYYTVFGLDAFNMDDYVPGEDTVARAEIRLLDAEYTDTEFTDPEILAALSTMLQNQNEADRQNLCSPFREYASSFSLVAVMYTKLGIPIARYYTVSKATPGAQEFLALYASDARMDARFDETLDLYRAHADELCQIQLELYPHSYREMSISISELLRLYTREIAVDGTVGYARLRQSSIGHVKILHYDKEGKYLDIDSGEMRELPLYADMTETLALLEEAVEKHMQLAAADPSKEYAYTKAEGASLITAGYLCDVHALRANSEIDALVDEYSYTYLNVYPAQEIELTAAQNVFTQLCAAAEPRLSQIFTEIRTDYVLVAQFGEELQEDTLREEPPSADDMYAEDTYYVTVAEEKTDKYGVYYETYCIPKDFDLSAWISD